MGNALVITTGGLDTEEGNPNIQPSTILAGYTAYGFDGDILIGSMPNKTFSLANQNPGTEIPIPLGWQDGSGTITSTTLSSKTGASADAGHVLTGYSGWKSGSKISGSMANKGTTNGTLSANGTYTVPVGWHNGNGKVTQSLSTQGATTVTPGTSNKTVIAASKWSTGNQVVSGNGNLTAGNIKNGVNIFGVTGNYVGVPIQPYITNGWNVWGGGNGITIEVNELKTNSNWTNALLGASGEYGGRDFAFSYTYNYKKFIMNIGQETYFGTVRLYPYARYNTWNHGGELIKDYGDIKWTDTTGANYHKRDYQISFDLPTYQNRKIYFYIDIRANPYVSDGTARFFLYSSYLQV